MSMLLRLLPVSRCRSHFVLIWTEKHLIERQLPTRGCCDNTQFYFSLELLICFCRLSIPTRPHLSHFNLFADTGLCSPVWGQLILVPVFWRAEGVDCLLCSLQLLV